MASVLEGLPRESRVAVLRLRSLGDCVLTTPALAILKRYRPDLRVAVMVEDRFRAIFEGNSDVDEILQVSLGALRGWRPRLCLNLHGGTRSAWLTAASGAKFRVGFGHFRHQLAYNVKIPRAQEILQVDRKVHTAEHLASAIFYLGAPLADVPPGRTGLPACPGQTGRSVLLHPVAATQAKTWRADGFIAVAEYLKQSGLDPIFIAAPEDDLSPFSAFRTIQSAPLSEIKSLLNRASLFIGNDSGPAHLAAACGLPVVVIFSASDPAIWGPWRTTSEVITAPASIAQVLDAVKRMQVHA